MQGPGRRARATLGRAANIGIVCAPEGLAPTRDPACEPPALHAPRHPVMPAQVGPKLAPVQLNEDGSLNYDSVVANYDAAMDWLAELYANTMNIIHYMHGAWPSGLG